MALTAGSRLGTYEIVSRIGTGGMGEVYRARDLKLSRDVAIKVLPEATAAEPLALSRFQNEARAVAEPLANVDSITMYGEGNSAHMVGDITKSISQINAGLGDSLGLDLQQLFSALVGAKLVSPTISDAVEEGVRDAASPKPAQE